MDSRPLATHPAALLLAALLALALPAAGATPARVAERAVAVPRSLATCISSEMLRQLREAGFDVKAQEAFERMYPTVETREIPIGSNTLGETARTSMQLRMRKGKNVFIRTADMISHPRGTDLGNLSSLLGQLKYMGVALDKPVVDAARRRGLLTEADFRKYGPPERFDLEAFTKDDYQRLLKLLELQSGYEASGKAKGLDPAPGSIVYRGVMDEWLDFYIGRLRAEKMKRPGREHGWSEEFVRELRWRIKLSAFHSHWIVLHEMLPGKGPGQEVPGEIVATLRLEQSDFVRLIGRKIEHQGRRYVLPGPVLEGRQEYFPYFELGSGFGSRGWVPDSEPALLTIEHMLPKFRIKREGEVENSYVVFGGQGGIKEFGTVYEAGSWAVVGGPDVYMRRWAETLAHLFKIVLSDANPRAQTEKRKIFLYADEVSRRLYRRMGFRELDVDKPELDRRGKKWWPMVVTAEGLHEFVEAVRKNPERFGGVEAEELGQYIRHLVSEEAFQLSRVRAVTTTLGANLGTQLQEDERRRKLAGPRKAQPKPKPKPKLKLKLKLKPKPKPKPDPKPRRKPKPHGSSKLEPKPNP